MGVDGPNSIHKVCYHIIILVRLMRYDRSQEVELMSYIRPQEVGLMSYIRPQEVGLMSYKLLLVDA